MKFLASIALLITATSAIPVEKLFTLVTAGASTSSHNGLHVTTQSTGPLNSNAVFGPAATAATFFASNEAVHYEAPNGGPWEMALVQSRDVKGAVEVSVSPTTGSKGFVVADNGTLLVEGQTWGGWLGKLRFFGLG